MEKKYEKPQILFENIQINSDVAVGGCKYVGVPNQGEAFIEFDLYAAYVTSGVGFAYANDSNCDIEPLICYHHPNDVDAYLMIGLS